MSRMTVIAAGAGIHCCQNDHPTGVCQRTVDPRNRHLSVLDRLTEDFKRHPVKFGKLIQKQNAVMRKGNLSRTRDRSAA